MTVALGQTRVMAVVTAALEAPYPSLPNEGSVRFNVEFSPMASPSFQPGRPGKTLEIRNPQVLEPHGLRLLSARQAR